MFVAVIERKEPEDKNEKNKKKQNHNQKYKKEGERGKKRAGEGERFCTVHSLFNVLLFCKKQGE